MNQQQREENEKKKAFLNSYRKAREELKRLEEERQEVRLNKLLPSQVIDGMPHGSGGSDLSVYAAKIDEIEREINAARYQCIRTLLYVKNAINEMEDEKEKELLTYRYIRCLSWEKVAEKMGYSYRHTTKLHGRALIHLQIGKEDLECPI